MQSRGKGKENVWLKGILSLTLSKLPRADSALLSNAKNRLLTPSVSQSVRTTTTMMMSVCWQGGSAQTSTYLSTYVCQISISKRNQMSSAIPYQWHVRQHVVRDS